MKLTAHQREVLTRLLDTPNANLARSVLGGWWLGMQRLDSKTGFWLLRNCLISSDTEDEEMQYFRTNSYTRLALEDPDWTIASEMVKSLIAAL